MQSAGYVRRCASKEFSDPGSIPGASTTEQPLGCSIAPLIATPALRFAPCSRGRFPAPPPLFPDVFGVRELLLHNVSKIGPLDPSIQQRDRGLACRWRQVHVPEGRGVVLVTRDGPGWPWPERRASRGASRRCAVGCARHRWPAAGGRASAPLRASHGGSSRSPARRRRRRGHARRAGAESVQARAPRGVHVCG